MMKSLCFLLLMLLCTGGRAQQQHTAEQGADVLRFDSLEAHFPRLQLSLMRFIMDLPM